MRTETRRPTSARGARTSVENAVGAHQERGGQREAEGLRRLPVDDQLVGARLLDGELGGRRPLEDAIDIRS